MEYFRSLSGTVPNADRNRQRTVTPAEHRCDWRVNPRRNRDSRRDPSSDFLSRDADDGMLAGTVTNVDVNQTGDSNQSVVRAIAIVEAVAASRDGLSISALARTVSLP